MRQRPGERISSNSRCPYVRLFGGGVWEEVFFICFEDFGVGIDGGVSFFSLFFFGKLYWGFEEVSSENWKFVKFETEELCVWNQFVGFWDYDMEWDCRFQKLVSELCRVGSWLFYRCPALIVRYLLSIRFTISVKAMLCFISSFVLFRACLLNSSPRPRGRGGRRGWIFFSCLWCIFPNMILYPNLWNWLLMVLPPALSSVIVSWKPALEMYREKNKTKQNKKHE